MAGVSIGVEELTGVGDPDGVTVGVEELPGVAELLEVPVGVEELTGVAELVGVTIPPEHRQTRMRGRPVQKLWLKEMRCKCGNFSSALMRVSQTRELNRF